jgi:acyl dehydratase
MTPLLVRPDHAGVEIGTALPPRTFTITRADLVRYAAASGDFNPIHWSERIARSAGLPDVIGHGMLTMALAIRVVTDWVGEPGAVVEYGTRFLRPVIVPDDDTGVPVTVTATVTERLAAPLVRIELTVRCGGAKVLGRTRAIVALGGPR